MQHPAWGAGRRSGAGKGRSVSREDRSWGAQGTAPPGLGAGGQRPTRGQPGFTCTAPRPSPQGSWCPLCSWLFPVQIKPRSSAALLNVNLSS